MEELAMEYGRRLREFKAQLHNIQKIKGYKRLGYEDKELIIMGQINALEWAMEKLDELRDVPMKLFPQG